MERREKILIIFIGNQRVAMLVYIIKVGYKSVYGYFRITQLAVAPAGFALVTSSWDQTVR